MISLVIESGYVVLVHPCGGRQPLRRAGRPIEALPPGWSVNAVHPEFAPTTIIILTHADGSAQRWVVDALGETYEQPISCLPMPMRGALHSGMTRILRGRRSGEEMSGAVWDALPRLTRLELLADFISAGGHSLIDPMCALDMGRGASLDVCSDDDHLSVLLPGGLELPLLLHGSVLRNMDFQPGWAAFVLYLDFAPFYLLKLRHADGQEATWVLDRNFVWIGDINALPQAARDELGSRAASVIRRHVDSVVDFAGPDDEIVKQWLEIDCNTRASLCALCESMIYPEPTSLDLQQIEGVFSVAASRYSHKLVSLQRDAIRKAVTTDLHRQTIMAIKEGCLQWPSPADGSRATMNGVLIWGDYAFFYRFADRNGLNFFVIASDRSARMIGLLLPASNLLLFDSSQLNSQEPSRWLRDNLGGSVWELLARHVHQYAQDIAARPHSKPSRMVNVMLTHPRVHIGHHLWNDLSGFEALCDAVSPQDIPTTMILGGADGNAEFFGPVEALFPATSGRIDRSLETADQFVRWAYRNDVWPARITREYVSASLRRRVMDHLSKADEVSCLLNKLAMQRRDRRPAPVIIFGLRVEDRTLVDLSAFCQAFVGFMAERHPGSTIVFDGYNCRPGRTGGAVNPGMVHHLARQPPERIEADLVAALAEQFDGQPITLVGTTGQSIATSLAWCRNAVAAFAIWGAGLTKIRWLANLPTMLVTSRNNMLHRNDIAIYHDLKFMEGPTPVVMPPPSLITDAPGHVALATGFIQGGRECFVVDTDRILSVFETFLDRLIPGAGAL